MIDAFKQNRKVWRYVVIKSTNHALETVAVLAAAYWGILAGAAVLAIRFGLHVITDLTFFAALVHANGREP